MEFLGTVIHLLHALFALNVQTSMRRVCYVANWAQYRETPVKFVHENLDSLVDPSLCTHIVLAFLDVTDGIMVKREWNDEEMIDALLSLKDRNPDLKVMVAIGGWNAGTEPFTNIISNPGKMIKFNKAAVTFLREYELDGLDLDFEYPANRGSPSQDRERFTIWVKLLAAEFEAEAASTGREKLILSSAIGAGKTVIDTGYEIKEISKWLDFMNVMTYDFHGAWDATSGLNAALRSNDPARQETTVEFAIDYWLSKGADAQKLNLGIPLYGRSVRLCLNATEPKIGAPVCEAGPAGVFTVEPGVNAYFETCLKEQCRIDGENLYESTFDEAGKAPYLYSQEANDWVSTENPTSVVEKTNFAVHERKLGGIAVWTIDFDDYADFCGQGSQPLLRAINNAMYIYQTPEQQSHHRNKRLRFPRESVDPCQGLLVPDGQH